MSHVYFQGMILYGIVTVLGLVESYFMAFSAHCIV